MNALVIVHTTGWYMMCYTTQYILCTIDKSILSCIDKCAADTNTVKFYRSIHSQNITTKLLMKTFEHNNNIFPYCRPEYKYPNITEWLIYTPNTDQNALFIFIYLKHFYTNHLLSANHVAFVFGGNFYQLKLCNSCQ